MKKIPSLPRHVPDVTVGDPVDGGDVIDCRVVVGEIPETGVRAVLADDGVWEVAVPAQPVALTDLAELSDEPRLGDDGWRAAGAVLMRRLGALVAGHPVRAKRHTVQISLPGSTTTMNLRNLAQGLMLGSRRIAVRRKDAPAEVGRYTSTWTDWTLKSSDVPPTTWTKGVSRAARRLWPVTSPGCRATGSRCVGGVAR